MIGQSLAVAKKKFQPLTVSLATVRQPALGMDHHIEGGDYINKRQARLRFRQNILTTWGNACAYCGTQLGKTGTLDHVRPKMRGGLTHQQNLVACCLQCNISKSADYWIDWYRKQQFWSQKREDYIRYWITQSQAA